MGLAGIALLLALGAAACGGSVAPVAQPQTTPPTAAPAPTTSASQAETPAVVAPTAQPAQAAAAPSPEPAEAASSIGTSAPLGRTGDEKLAPELVGIDGWINTEPFTLASLRGNVVLIDIWTYTCINCIRTFPFLKDWHEKYADQGLVIVGVHTPEFDFEKIKENVVEAAGEHGLGWAIVQDNDYATWDAYENQFWPAKYLIDKDGYIRYIHFGEGSYAETEEKIQELLKEAGSRVDDILVDRSPEPEVDFLAVTADRGVGLTRELYAGVKRNYSAAVSRTTPPYVRHDEFYEQVEVDLLYRDPGEHANHFLYLQGLWNNGLESLTHARETEDFEDYMAFKYYATSVNVVMTPEGGSPYRVRITIDGEPLAPDHTGSDIRFDDDGNSYVLVDGPRMYRLVEVAEFDGHELRLSSNSADFSVFAFTFGAYKNSP
jgi:thiol-disulfide isomerase/thioredoxin